MRSTISRSGIATLAFIIVAKTLAGHPALAQAAAAKQYVDAAIGKSNKGHNRITVSVTLCPVGVTDPDKCLVVPHVMVDTGSTGLRIQSSAVGQSIGNFQHAMSGRNEPLFECERFVGRNNNAWGSIRRVDVTIGTMVVHDLEVQFIDDPHYDAPAACRSDMSVTSNGTLGIDWHKLDPTTFEARSEGSYRQLESKDRRNHLRNPVSQFATRNNGEVFDFPALKEGDTTVTGRIIFGVNTDDDNTIGPSASYLPLDGAGEFTTSLFGTTYRHSYIDSGTPDLMFANAGIYKCPDGSGYYYNNTNSYFEATLQENDGALPANGQADPAVDAHFDIASQLQTCGAAPPQVGYTARTSSDAGGFVWGVPLFIGRRVFLVQGRKTAAGGKKTGQLYAFDKAS